MSTMHNYKVVVIPKMQGKLVRPVRWPVKYGKTLNRYMTSTPMPLQRLCSPMRSYLGSSV